MSAAWPPIGTTEPINKRDYDSDVVAMRAQIDF